MATSTIFNVLLLIAFAFITIGVTGLPDDFAVDSLLDQKDEKKDEPIEVLRENDTVATTLNTQAGATLTSKVSVSPRRSMQASQPVTENVLAELEIAPPSPTAVGIGREEMSYDVGDEDFKGEPTAIVQGYGDALNRITQEIIRLMRKDKLLVVWLFDESESMKDDQKEIAKNFHIVYKELGIVKKKRTKKLRSKLARDQAEAKEVLLTAVYGYGESIHKMLDPTSDADKIIKTIGSGIKIDESGKENMCTAIARVVQTYRARAAKQKRKLVVIVVSDESGDDGAAVELTLKSAKRAKAPLYFLGRESIFGYPYARHRWIDPKTGLPHWLRINRGPETSYPECLQWDGLHARWDAFSSGFGPYEQVRLARETNGIFFVLPNEEANLAGAGARDKRQFAAHDMREYHPLWLARTDYDRQRVRSKFRKTIWEVIIALNPTEHPQKLIPRFDRELNIRELHYAINLNEFKSQAGREVVKAYKAWITLAKAIQLLESIEPLRAEESSTRWRANYDLARAQCLAFRVRLFQYMLAMDDHANANPPRKPRPPATGKKPSNEWNVGRRSKMIVPNDAQYERIKKAFRLKLSKDEFLAELKKQEDRARELYQVVATQHPGTPWARRANWELSRGFGMFFWDRFWDPRYRNPVKLPKF